MTPWLKGRTSYNNNHQQTGPMVLPRESWRYSFRNLRSDIMNGESVLFVVYSFVKEVHLQVCSLHHHGSGCNRDIANGEPSVGYLSFRVPSSALISHANDPGFPSTYSSVWSPAVFLSYKMVAPAFQYFATIASAAATPPTSSS